MRDALPEADAQIYTNTKKNNTTNQAKKTPLANEKIKRFIILLTTNWQKKKEQKIKTNRYYRLLVHSVPGVPPGRPYLSANRPNRLTVADSLSHEH